MNTISPGTVCGVQQMLFSTVEAVRYSAGITSVLCEASISTVEVTLYSSGWMAVSSTRILSVLHLRQTVTNFMDRCSCVVVSSFSSVVSLFRSIVSPFHGSQSLQFKTNICATEQKRPNCKCPTMSIVIVLQASCNLHALRFNVLNEEKYENLMEIT